MNNFPPRSAIANADYDSMVDFGEFVAIPGSLGSFALGDKPKALDWACSTHAGLVRLHNEDSVRIEPDMGLFVLADGMGGYNAGEVASAIAANYVVELLTAKHKSRGSKLDKIFEAKAAIQTANEKIVETAALRPECLGMGTTILLAWLQNQLLTYAHVGDSRLYRWQNRRLQCLTRDHSVGQEMIDSGVVSGEQARTIAARGILTRALGADAQPDVEITQLKVETGDLFLMCSDGLTDMVDDKTISSILLAAQADGPEELCHMLINEALAQGGSDNVTVTIIQA